MAACRRCGTALPGRQQKCEPCKAAAATTKPAPEDPAPLAAASAAAEAPAGLHSRGRRMWAAFGVGVGTPAGELALEVCRSADRLDELDRVIAGKGVLQLMKFRLSPDWWDDKGDQHVHVEVGFQSVLGEARGQQATFAKMLSDLTAALDEQTGGGTAQSPASAPVSALDQLAARRAQREQAPS